jgi:TRAP-type mannitol/chloroaromatic compound transport system permease small subunit
MYTATIVYTSFAFFMNALYTRFDPTGPVAMAVFDGLFVAARVWVAAWSAIGRAAAWLVLFVVAVQFAVVVMRYVLGIGSIKLNESILYGHAALLMLAAAWTLREEGHVRVDIFYADAGPRAKAWTDFLGALFLLLPFALLLVWTSLPYVARSWAILERSRETSGLPFVYLLKSLIPAFAVLLMLQGVAQALRAFEALSGKRRAAP